MSKSNRPNESEEGQPHNAREAGEPDHEDLDEGEQPGAYDSEDDEKEEAIQPGDRDFNLEDELSCPVTRYIFLEPVEILPMGITLEREYAEYLVRYRLGYPLHNSNPKVTDLRGDPEMKERVSQYLNDHPDALQTQYQRGLLDMPAPAVDDPEENVFRNEGMEDNARAVVNQNDMGFEPDGARLAMYANDPHQFSMYVERVLSSLRYYPFDDLYPIFQKFDNYPDLQKTFLTKLLENKDFFRKILFSSDVQTILDITHRYFESSPELEKKAIAILVDSPHFVYRLISHVRNNNIMPQWPVSPDYQQLVDVIIANPYTLGTTRSIRFWDSFPQEIIQKAKEAMKELHETQDRKLTKEEKFERAIIAGDPDAINTLDVTSQKFYNLAISVLLDINDSDKNELMKAQVYLRLLNDSLGSPSQQLVIISAVLAMRTNNVLKEAMEAKINREELKVHIRDRMMLTNKRHEDIVGHSFYQQYVTPIHVNSDKAAEVLLRIEAKPNMNNDQKKELLLPILASLNIADHYRDIITALEASSMKKLVKEFLVITEKQQSHVQPEAKSDSLDISRNKIDKANIMLKTKLAFSNYLENPNENNSFEKMLATVILLRDQSAAIPHVGRKNKLFGSASTTTKLLDTFIKKGEMFADKKILQKELAEQSSPARPRQP